MTLSTKEDITKHRIKKFHQAMKDALLLIDNQGYLSAANRIYYAAFYIVTAYFAQQSIIVKSHKGISIKVHSDLVLKNLITAQEGKLFDELMSLRDAADYDDFVISYQSKMKELYSQTESFIIQIESLITINE